MSSRITTTKLIIALTLLSMPAFAAYAPNGSDPSLDQDVEVISNVQSSNSVELEMRLPEMSVLAEKSVDWLIERHANPNAVTDMNDFPGMIHWIVVPSSGSLIVQASIVESVSSQTVLSSSQATNLNLSKELIPTPEVLDVRVGTPRLFNGRWIAPLLINPFSIHDGRLLQATQIKIEVSADESRAGNQDQTFQSPTATAAKERLLSSFVLNPPGGKLRRDDYAEGISRMMIIYNENIDNEETLSLIEDLAEWKRRCGLVVDLVAYDYSDGDFEEAAGEIKDIVSNYLNLDPPLEYLTIIGDDTTMLLNTGMTFEDVDEELIFPSHPILDVVMEIDGEDTTFYETVKYGDHPFSVVGDDELVSEIKVGRFASPRYDMLNGALLRSLEYERDPYPGPDGEEGDWYRRGLLSIEPDSASGMPNRRRYDLQNWAYQKLMRNGYDDVSKLWRLPGDESDLREAITDRLEEGVSIALADGWLLGASHRDTEHNWSVDNPWDYPITGRMNPFVLAQGKYYVNREHTFISYMFFNTGNVEALNGPVATLGSYYGPDNTPTYYAYASAAKAILIDNITEPGDLQLISKLHLLARLEPWLNIEEANRSKYINNLRFMNQLGDPSVDIYTAPPEELVVGHPEVYQFGQNGLSFNVTDANNHPVSDAIVCVRQLSEDDEWQLVTYTDGSGSARFTLPEGLWGNDLQVTVRKHNFFPYIVDVPVDFPVSAISLTDWNFDDSDGDNDGLLRNGESLLLQLTLENIGEGDASSISLAFNSNSDKMSIEPEEVDFSDLGAGEAAELDEDVTITLAPDAQGGGEYRIGITVLMADEPLSELAIEFVSSGPAFKFLDSDASDINPGDEGAEFYFESVNYHDKDLGSSTWTLTSLSNFVEVTGDPLELDGVIGAMDTVIVSFMTNVSDLTVNGATAWFELMVEDEFDYDTTLTVSAVITSPLAADPLGPDNYGYYCFDSGDEEWLEAPRYDWLEINPNLIGSDYNGTLLEQNYDVDNDRNNGYNSEVVGLPFDFNYYGESFDSITVNINGWIAMGTAADDFISANSQPIGSYAAPDAQIAACWQDLWVNRFTGTEGIYTYSDTVAGTFIIEWSEVQVFISGGGRRTFTFQIILYDPELYPTTTGDGIIKIQYKDFESLPGPLDHTEFQYAFIGMRNLDGTDGLQYSYWDSLAAQANPIETPFAIKFIPAVLNEYGGLAGRIIEAGNGDGVANARLTHPRFPDIVSDEEGNFEALLLPGNYSNVIVSAQAAIPDTINFEIVVDELTKPEIPPLKIVAIQVTNESGFDLDNLSLRPNGTDLNLKLKVKNIGSGDLIYQAKPDSYDGVVTIDSLLNFSAALPNDNHGDNKVYGSVVVNDTLLYVPEQSARTNQDRRYIFVYNFDGKVRNTIVQPQNDNLWTSQRGFRALASDGTYLWGVCENNLYSNGIVVRFTTRGNFISSFVSPLSYDASTAASISYVESRGTLLITGPGASIYEIETNGDVVNEWEIEIPEDEFSGSGITWHEHDPDGMHIYFMHETGEDTLDYANIYRLDPETGDYSLWITSDPFQGIVGFTGMGIIPDYGDRSDLVFGTLIKAGNANNPQSRFHLFTIGPDYSLFSAGIENAAGTLEPGDSSLVFWTFNATGYPAGIHKFSLLVTHNGHDDGDTSAIRFPITFEVDDSSIAEDYNGNITPNEFGLTSVYPNPFNSTLRVQYYLQTPGVSILTLHDLSGRQVATLSEEYLRAGTHTAILNGVSLPSGLYFVHLESAGLTQTRKIALIK